MGVTGRLGSFQRRHTWLGFPLAVAYKFVDDQAATPPLITYCGFLSGTHSTVIPPCSTRWSARR
jgi:membrane protein